MKLWTRRRCRFTLIQPRLGNHRQKIHHQFFLFTRPETRATDTSLKFPVPPAKRQKIFDIEEERACASIQSLDAGKTPLEDLFLLRRLHKACPYTTPSYIIRILHDLNIPVVGIDSTQNYSYTTEEILYTFESHSLPEIIQKPFIYSLPPRTAKEPRRFYNELLRKSVPEKKMAASGDSQLFEETFTITAIDDKKYDRVARIEGHSQDGFTSMSLDINTELWPIQHGDNIKMVLASSLALDGSKDDGRGWRDIGRSGEPTLADMFEYVCHGKCYKFEDGSDGQTM